MNNHLQAKLHASQGQETEFLKTLVETVIRLEKRLEQMEKIVVRKIKVAERKEAEKLIDKQPVNNGY